MNEIFKDIPLACQSFARRAGPSFSKSRVSQFVLLFFPLYIIFNKYYLNLNTYVNLYFFPLGILK